MTSLSSTVSSNRNIFLYHIELLNDNDFFWTCSISATWTSKMSWSGYFQVRHEAMMKLAEIWREKETPHETHAIPMYQFSPLFHQVGPVVLKVIGAEQLRHMVQAWIEMVLYCQNDRNVYYILRWVFWDNKISVGFVNGASSIEKKMKTWPHTFVMARARSQPSAFNMQLSSMHLCSWKCEGKPSWYHGTGICRSEGDEGLEFMHAGSGTVEHSDCYTALHVLQWPDSDVWCYS